MRIGFIHEAYPFGGAEKVTSNIGNYLVSKGYEVYIFTYHLYKDYLLEKDKHHFLFVEINQKDLFGNNSIDNTLIKKVNQLKIDVLIHVGGSFKINRKNIITNTRCKHIFSLHGVPFWEIEDELANIKKKSKIKRRKVSRLKYKYIKPILFQWFNKRKIYRFYQDTYRLYDAITVLNDSYKTSYERKISLKNRGKIVVIPNALPANTYKLTKDKELLYVGRMSYADKRVDRLVEVWRRIYKEYPDWKFILVGDGSERANLEKLSLELNIERIYFKGQVQNPNEFYNTASILCLSSSIESWGLVLTEAQQAGVIPIAFNCSDGVEYILSPNGVNGILIPNFDIDLYEKELRKLMDDESLRLMMQKNVLKKAEEYDLNRVGEKWESLLKNIINEKNPYRP